MLNNILTHFSKILTLSLIGFVLQGCADILEDEKFEGIKGDFPRLVDVPDRPNALTAKQIDRRMHQLEADRQESERLAQLNYKMVEK